MSEDRQSAAPTLDPMPSLEHLRMLVPAYVLGALDASERALFERGLATPALARVLQGEIEMHRDSLSTMLSSPAPASRTAAAMPAEPPGRPAVRVDTSAYRDGADTDTERPKRPTPMYATAYRADEWEPGDTSRANGRSYKPAKARRTRDAERSGERSPERADRPTPRSVRVQPASRPVAASGTDTRGATSIESLDLPSMEAAVDDLFSDAWSTAPGHPEDAGFPTNIESTLPLPLAASPIPREPVVRRGKGKAGTKGEGRARKQGAPSRGAFDEGADGESALDDAYDVRSRRAARGRPWPMITLAAVALAAIGLAAWQGLRASRLQDRLLLQPTLDAVGSASTSPAVESEAAPGAPLATTLVSSAAPSAAATVGNTAGASASDDPLASVFDAKTGLTVVQFDPTAQGSTAGAQLFWNVERGTGVMHVFGLYPLAADRSYTLWILQSGRLSAVTRFRSDDQGRALVPGIPMPTSRAQVGSFAISVEPYGGSPRPSSVPVLIGDLDTASQGSAPRR